MGFRVFGSAEVLSVHTGAGQQAAHVRKQAHRAVFSYEPQPGYVYVRSRAISSRCNDNFDYFGPEEIEKAYKTFVGKPVFVNHHNSDHRQARGVIKDAALHKDRNPNGSPDTWVEVLMEVDGVTYPKLAAALVSGDIDRTSMGCDVQISKCSVCDNEAKNPLEYCRHIPNLKGQYVYKLQKDGSRKPQLVFEVCSGLSFFENSLLVEPPADPTAFFLDRPVIGAGLDHLASLAKAARLQEAVTEPAPAMQRTASRKTASFLDDYPSDDEISQMRQGTHPNNQGGFGGNQEPWKPYRHELENRPEPRVAYPNHIAQDGPSSRETGTRYKRVEPGTKGSFPESSPEDEYHGPYEVIKHPETGKHLIVDNQNRVARYGPRDGMADVHHAQYMRDYADHRQGSKEKARGLADSIFNKGMEILDPGGTEESRASDRNSHAMNSLLDHGYQPHQIKFDEDESPYGEVYHPSGWSARDYGGHGYLHIHHQATGDEAHDVIQLSESDQNGREYRKPAYGPTEAHQDLSAWHDDHETGAREHYEQNDPRIRRWKQRQRFSSLRTAARGEDVHNFTVSAIDKRTGGEVGTMLREPLCADHRTQLQAQLDQHNATGHPHEYHAITAFPQRDNVGCSACTIREVNDAFGGHTGAAKQPAPKKTSKADQFLVDNPPDPQNLVAMFHQAKPGQKAEGMDWYQHMHRTARMITGGKVSRGKVTGGNPALGAGLLANYSQQSSLSDNHWKASKSVLAGKGLWSGNNPGMFAGEEQAKKADRMISGEHHSQVLGAPKTRNFAHLIEHGGDDQTGHTAVCIDRHALSAAIGRRANDEDFAQANLSAAPSAADKKAGHTENHRYRMVADSYRAAADQLSRETGQQIAPHHVQAVTWVVQRDQNAEAEAKETDPNRQKLIKGRITKNTNETARWNEHVEQHYPQFHQTQEHWKMTKLQPRQGYNETLAPTTVDTLRDESCPICGNDIAFNGSECQVCGYIQPPKPLGDPDVEKAKQLDQLKQNIEDERNQSGLDPSQMGADFDAGDPDNTLPGGDNSAAPWLSCATCGTELRPAAAQTAPADGAQDGPQGPAEGGQCPVCGEGPLMSSDVSEDDTDEQATEGEQDPGAEGAEVAPEEGEEPDSDDDEDGDEPDDKKKPTKNPAKGASAAAKYRDHSKEFPMQNGLASLAKLNEQVAHQAQYINAQQRALQRQASQISRLAASLTVVARHLGPEVDFAMRRAAFLKRADEQNPAQPIPEPAPQPPTQTTVQAETPEAFADVRAPGMVPGVNNDVAADAVTTTYTPGADIATSPLRQLVDPTAPVEGTQGPRPVSEVKTNVDVRAGNPMNPQVAFPLGGDFAQAQRTSAVQTPEGNDLRTMASIRLARLRIQHGMEQGDDLSVGHRIASDVTMSMEKINNEITTLNTVAKAAARSAAPMPPRGAVPRPAAPPQRIVPPLSPQSGFSMTAGSRNQEDEDLASALL